MSQQANDTALLLEMMRQFREDYAHDQAAASQSRAAMRDRIDALFDRFAKLETTAALSAEVDAQVRTELDALTKALTEVEPVAVEWNRVKSIGKWAASGLLASGVGIGALVASAGDQVVAAVRAWLRIP